MPSFEWKGRDRHGNAQTGVLIGETKDAVIAALRKQQIVVTTVKEKGKEIALPKFGGGISSKTIAVFTRQFSVMIDAGLPLVQCLEILGQQQDNKAFQKVLLQVRQDVESGLSLAEALRKQIESGGAGAEARNSIGIILVSGMAIGTVPRMTDGYFGYIDPRRDWYEIPLD